MTLAAWQELVWQLHRLPGGGAAAIPDFFASRLADAPLDQLAPETRVAAASVTVIEAWPLREQGQLVLFGDEVRGLHLVHLQDTDSSRIADLPGELLAAARASAEDPASPLTVSPLVLALVAIAAGQVDDGRRLKRRLPGIDGAAKDLMLMTVCRLCG
jgi:hypothetical protein